MPYAASLLLWLWLLVGQICLAKASKHAEQPWSALEDQIRPCLVAGICKQRQPKRHELRKREPRRQEALPVKV